MYRCIDIYSKLLSRVIFEIDVFYLHLSCCYANIYYTTPHYTKKILFITYYK